MSTLQRSFYTSTCSHDINYFFDTSGNQYTVRKITPKDRRNLGGFYIPRNSFILVEQTSERKFMYWPFFVKNKKVRDKLLSMLDDIDSDAMERKDFQALKNILLSLIATHIKKNSMQILTEATFINLDELYPQAYELFIMNRSLCDLDGWTDCNWLED